MQHRPIKLVMFHANDMKQHTLCWSDMGRHWMLENPKVGLVATFTCFGSAMQALFEFNNPMAWSITDNPYNGD